MIWSPVEKTALAEAEVEYHDHTSTTIWVRFPVVRSPIAAAAGASVVIWTTTPWTIPGNRAIAAGAEFDYALVHVDGVEDGSLARVGERLLVALPLLPQFLAMRGIATHHVVHVFKGAELAARCARIRCAGAATTHDTPLLLADFVTTEAGTGFVHIAPGHGEDDFVLGRAHGIEVPETVGDDGTFNAWVPLFAGCMSTRRDDPVCAALAEAGGLLARGKLVHSYPHSWRSKAPLIFRATPQWFIRLDGPERIRDKALAAIDATHFVPEQGRNRIGAWSPPPGLVHQPPARLGRADPGVRRARHRRAAARSGGGRPRGEALRRGRRRRLVFVTASRASSATSATRTTTSRSRTSSMSGSSPARPTPSCWKRAACPGRQISIWKAPTSIAAGSSRRCSRPSARAARPVQGGADAWLRHGRAGPQDVEVARQRHRAAGSRGQVRRRHSAPLGDELRHHEDLRIGPEILKQQAELYRRLRNTLRWLLGSLAGFTRGRARAATPRCRSWSAGSCTG